MRIKKFSAKQLSVLNWWIGAGQEKNGIICDGAVRSGKTLCLSLSFILWSFAFFDAQDFALCGKTIVSLRRNLVVPLMNVCKELRYSCKLILSRNLLEITYRGKTHRYHLFGGRDEGSSALIQGVTLAGVLFDEVALMPQSFVEQALARCSVEKAKYWFNCNPEHPSHWFYRDWIAKIKERNVLYLHFVMRDNPSLSSAVLARYEGMYSGVFYQRYVLGEWVAVHGAVYPMFSYEKHVVETVPVCERFVVSCDYGTTNPTSIGLWGFCGNTWYRIKEYYHSSKETGVVKTDEEYSNDLEQLVGDLPIEVVLVDPSAASFIQCLRKRGTFAVVPAYNNVLNGIRLVSSALTQGKIKIHAGCKKSMEEFSLYQWDLTAEKEAPLKKNDHAMDEIRYFVHYITKENNTAFVAITAPRRR